MKPIKFEHIPQKGLDLEEEFSVKKLSELLEEPERELIYSAEAPALFKFQVDREGTKALVKGRAVVALAHPCVRCLEPVKLEFEMLLEQELEKPESIDLEEMAREELFLELPAYPACEKPCI